MRAYRGESSPDGCKVTVNGYPLPPRLYLAQHSTTGFDWGGAGEPVVWRQPTSGAYQLALALLAFEFGDEIALRWYEPYAGVLTALPAEGWTMTGAEIRARVASLADSYRPVYL